MGGANEVNWDALLALVRAGAGSLYRAWFEDLQPSRMTGGEILVPVADPTRVAYLNETCVSIFSQAAMSLTGRLLTVRFIGPDEAGVPVASSRSTTSAPLNPDYTFDEFVVGASNRLAHAACRAVSERPGQVYNPLFIYGAPGLGKTHLLQATAAELLRADPRRRVLFLSSETFLNEYVKAIETGSLARFQNTVRGPDVLILDDLQFLGRRESCQDELFHTFNTLHEARRQIILSGDAAPTALSLEDRLTSRFSWGLVVHIDPPDRETRHAILQKKARLRGLEVHDDALDYIAERVHSNIRALEGALLQLTSYASELQVAPDRNAARSALTDLDPQPPTLTMDEILDAVSKHYRIRIGDLVGRRRTRSVTLPRHVGMYLARRLTSLSLEEIGARFGGRDHSTVLYAERLIDRNRESDPGLEQTLSRLTQQLASSRQSRQP